MTSGAARGPQPRPRVGVDGLVALLLFSAIFALYLVCLPPSVLRSDSGEFQVVPYVLGIAHAPGYPLLTLLGWLAMRLPVGDPAYRINLLDAAAAAGAVGLVYLAVVEIAGRRGPPMPVAAGQPADAAAGSDGEANRALPAARAGGLAGALALGLGATYWQQAIVGGPRPLIFLFTALLLYLTFRWGNRRGPGDLLLLALAAGLALTHHPNLALLLPGLALYLLGRDPRLPLRLRQVGPALLFFLAPLLLYAYLPLRSAQNPPLGPLNLTEPRELLLFVTATHYQDTVLNNCDSPAGQAERYLIFLRLQYGERLPYLAAAGALFTLIGSPLAALVLLYAFASNAVFGICSSLAMPDYIVPSYLVAALSLGLGLAWPLRWLGRLGSAPLRLGTAGLVALVVLGVGGQRLITALPYQSMVGRAADGERAQAGLAQVQPNALVLSDWEAITPIWYGQQVEGVGRGVKSAMITAPPNSQAWLLEAVQALEDHPVSLAQRVPSFGEEYRLFPIGSFHEVLPKQVSERATNVGLLTEDRAIRLLGYRLNRPAAAPGELVGLTLYAKTDKGTEAPYLPALRVGGRWLFQYDTALRYLTTTWSDNEVIGETYQFVVPSEARPGPLSLELAYQIAGTDQLVGLTAGAPWTPLGLLQVLPPPDSALPPPPSSLASFGDQLALRAGRLTIGESSFALGDASAAPTARPGQRLRVELIWSSRRWLDESYTLFVHLLDADNHLVAQRDTLPLGGVYHTYKWVPGQAIRDWYDLTLPPALPPGPYRLEIGAYHSVTTRRLPLLEPSGATHTALLWGPIRVE